MPNSSTMRFQSAPLKSLLRDPPAGRSRPHAIEKTLARITAGTVQHLSVLSGSLLAADVNGTSGFRSGIPTSLFRITFAPGIAAASGPPAIWDVAADGKRFITAARENESAESAPPPFNVVLNWQGATAH